MPKPAALKPHDTVLLLRLAEAPEAPYLVLAADLGVSPSTAHGSVERLRLSGLLRPGSRQVNRHFLLEFLEHGVKYMFPAATGARARGVPTAWSGPPLANEFAPSDPVVWPDVNGHVVGQSLTPLYGNAARLASACPSVYELLTLVDAIRVGRVRERAAAVEKLRERLRAAA